MHNLTTTIALITAVLCVVFLASCKKEESNKNPAINSVTVVPIEAETNNQAAVTVVASDPDGDQLTYNYTVSGGTIQGNGATATWSTPSQANTYSVTANVSDGKGGNASFEVVMEVVAAPTKITGSAGLPAGTSGNLSDAQVSIYTSLTNWNNDTPFQTVSVIGTGSSVTFIFTDLTPGNYYLDIWKDNDNNSGLSVGDYFGWYGTGGLENPNLIAIDVSGGETKDINVDMLIIETPATKISGTASFASGNYDLSNSEASIYTSFENWSNYNPEETVTVIGSGSSVTFEFPDVDPGTYLLDVWKDNDSDNLWSDGDYVGWYGDENYLFEINIEEGEVLDFEITMYILQAKSGSNFKKKLKSHLQ